MTEPLYVLETQGTINIPKNYQLYTTNYGTQIDIPKLILIIHNNIQVQGWINCTRNTGYNTHTYLKL